MPYQQDAIVQKHEIVLTCFLGFNSNIVPVCSLPVQSFSDSYSSIVWVYFESFCVISPFVNRISGRKIMETHILAGTVVSWANKTL